MSSFLPSFRPELAEWRNLYRTFTADRFLHFAYFVCYGRNDGRVGMTWRGGRNDGRGGMTGGVVFTFRINPIGLSIQD
jgi:hypothetical protein